MKNRLPLHSLLFVAGGLLVAQFSAIPALRADLVNGQAAQSVLGKPNFTEIALDGPNATEMDRAEGIAIDPGTKKLFVSDAINNRILRFATAAAYQTGAAAEAVFGQADFISGSANRGGAVAANTLNNPLSLCVDLAGRLWVGDSSNRRILRFDGASTKASGVGADAVLGQSTFVSFGAATSQSGITSATGVVTDALGNLYVADMGNHRILIFYNAAAKGNGANADRVLGQANFTSALSGTTASTFNQPWGVSVNAQGQLWVADYTNNRVLRFDNVATIANGAAASVVIGQVNFTTGAAQPLSASSLNGAYCVAAAPDGTLWVGDYLNHRVLGFRNSTGFVTGSSASLVLGQPDFVTNGTPGPSSTTISTPSSIAVDIEGGLFVSDNSYDRVMRFSGVVKLTTPSRITAAGGKALLRGTSQHASQVRFKLPGKPFADAKGPASRWKAKVKGFTRPVTRVRVEAVALDKRKASKIVKVKNG
jgi:sugar lactone lactonase YvrE